MSESENRTLSDKFMLRLPDGMRERIRVTADANNRSMNAEIVAALEIAFPSPIEGSVSRSALLTMLGTVDGLTEEAAGVLAEHVDAQMVIRARKGESGRLEFLITPPSNDVGKINPPPAAPSSRKRRT